MHGDRPKTVKIICPVCGESSYQWHAEGTDSDGTIIFREGDIDIDVIITEFTISCPSCNEEFGGMSTEDILEFVKEHAEVDR